MGSFLGLSFQVWQTLLIIAFPLLYRSLPRLKAFWHRLRRTTPPETSSQNPNPNEPSLVSSLSIREILQRLAWPRIFFLGSLFITLLLRCTRFSPSNGNPFKIGRLPLNASPAALIAALARYHRARGLADTPSEQQRLLQRLSNLDARLLFSIVGPDSLLNCRWCRPLSKEDLHVNDHFLYTFPRLSFQYALALVAIGLITTGASQVEAKRRLWRIRLAITLFTSLTLESMVLLVCLGMPSLAMDTKGQGRMIWEKLYLLRHVCFGVLFLIAGWSIVTESADTNTTAIARLGIHIASVSHQLDTLVSRLRIAALQRSTIMRDHEYRDQSNRFWEDAETQAKVASSDKVVQSLRHTMGLASHHLDPTSLSIPPPHQTTDGRSRQELRTWIENAYPVPALSTSATPDPITS